MMPDQENKKWRAYKKATIFEEFTSCPYAFSGDTRTDKWGTWKLSYSYGGYSGHPAYMAFDNNTDTYPGAYSNVAVSWDMILPEGVYICPKSVRMRVSHTLGGTFYGIKDDGSAVTLLNFKGSYNKYAYNSTANVSGDTYFNRFRFTIQPKPSSYTYGPYAYDASIISGTIMKKPVF